MTYLIDRSNPRAGVSTAVGDLTSLFAGAASAVSSGKQSAAEAAAKKAYDEAEKRVPGSGAAASAAVFAAFGASPPKKVAAAADPKADAKARMHLEMVRKVNEFVAAFSAENASRAARGLPPLTVAEFRAQSGLSTGPSGDAGGEAEESSNTMLYVGGAAVLAALLLLRKG